jgi:beta-N-acetylhexosaminidase
MAAAVVIVGVAAGACGNDEPQRTASKPSPPSNESTSTDPQHIDAIERLSVDEQAGQLVMTAIKGQELSAEERRTIRSQHLGGIILFRYNNGGPRKLRALLNDIESLSRAGNKAKAAALISADQEGGTTRIFTELPPSTSQPHVTSLPEARIQQRGKATGRALDRIGVHIDLAPVADLSLPPGHVMAGRAFSAQADAAAAAIASTVTGLQEGGASATLKHFPGLGGGTMNTDEGVSVVRRTRAMLFANDVVPFKAGIDAGADVVMTSHATYLQLDRRHPATLSQAILMGLLRERLGFDGVVITDSMNAKGLRETWGRTVPQACPEAVRAGVDIVLLTGSMETARLCRQRIADAVKSGDLSEDRLHDAVQRVLELKRRHDLVGDAVAYED